MLFTTTAQKKLVPVTQSTVTGIALPEGAKNDGRGLSVLAGKFLLEAEAKKTGTSIKAVEILYLPSVAASGFTYDSLSQQLSALGWTVSGNGSEAKYMWFKKDDRSLLAYFSPEENISNLYFAETTTASTLPGNNNTTVVDPQNTGNIQQPLPDNNNVQAVQINNDVHAPVAFQQNGFTFSTTNFDNGWTSTVQEDWVEVTKGNIRVLLHYPKEGTVFPADPEPLTNAAWNILVAPRYKDLTNYRTAYITTYNRPYLGMGYATEIATGKKAFILLFRQGQGWIEFITPDKNSFIQEYKFDPETIQWNSESDLMIPLGNMAGYNKFSIAASDFKGKWTSDFTGIQQLYHVYTGDYAGMNINQSNEEFVFGDGNSYNWKLLVINGMVGNTKFNQVKSSGRFTVPNNWQIQFSDIENKARTYHAHWSCIKGARILNLLDANSPGSGIYTQYGMAK